MRNCRTQTKVYATSRTQTKVYATSRSAPVTSSISIGGLSAGFATWRLCAFAPLREAALTPSRRVAKTAKAIKVSSPPPSSEALIVYEAHPLQGRPAEDSTLEPKTPALLSLAVESFAQRDRLRAPDDTRAGS
jgi:hypothetical protein